MLLLHLATAALAGPALGPLDLFVSSPGATHQFLCPVTMLNRTITPSTPSLELVHGQKLYFATSRARDFYVASPRDFWLSPHELPLSGPDGGMRGLPDLRGQNVTCPRSGETVTVSALSPRVVHRGGQAVYFCCFGCVNAWWTNPYKFFAPSVEAPPAQEEEERFGDGPPPGPSDKYICPVTGQNGTIGPSTPSVELTHGQKLHFATAAAASAFLASPRDYWLSPQEMPLAPPDGMRGLPDLRGLKLRCPESGMAITVAMNTPRLLLRGGQSVYFCCYGCVDKFWIDPAAILA